MSKKKNILFTGATGFIGAGLAASLMLRGHTLHCLARPRKGVVASDRVMRAIMLADHVMGFDESPSYYDQQCGSVMETDFYAFPLPAVKPDAIFHAAGDPRFAETHRTEIMEANLHATLRLLEFATRKGIREFHYIGSAMIHNFKYVTDVLETTACDRYGYVNPYTESKCLAEKALLAWGRIPGNRVFIYSPSIVIGHRESGITTSFTGWYQFMEPLYRLASLSIVQKAFKGYLNNLPFNVLGDPRATINLVTIDYVVDLITKIVQADVPGLYHITNNNPPIVEDLLQWGLQVIGIGGLHIGQPKTTGLSKVESIIQKGITRGVQPYEAFTSFAPRFSQRNAQRALWEDFYNQPLITPAIAHKLLSFACANDFKKERVEERMHLYTPRTARIVKELFKNKIRPPLVSA